jgi:hypothetical protein
LTRKLLLGSAGTVFTLHRFAHPHGDPNAAATDALDRELSSLRRLGFEFVALKTMLASARSGSLGANKIAFTVDDGYFDFFEVALPLFERHRCPVSVFLITGFVDGDLWPWWDQLEFAIFHGKGSFSFTTQTELLDFVLADESSRREALARTIGQLKLMPEERKCAVLREICDQLQVRVPDQALRTPFSRA